MPPSVTPDEAIEWAQTTLKEFNLQWSTMPALPNLPGMRVMGKTQSVMVDITLSTDRRVKLISMVVPIAAESTILMVHTLAAIHPTAATKDADQWLAKALKRLSKTRPSKQVTNWGDWAVELCTTAIGIMTMIVKPKRRV